MALVDEFARCLATQRFGLPLCLHIPIAARDESAVRTYVGEIAEIIVHGTPSKALLVNAILPTWWAIAAGALLVFLGARAYGSSKRSRSSGGSRDEKG